MHFRTKKVFLNLELMRNAFLFKNWLNFRKTQFLTQNGSKPSKTLVSTQNIEKPSLEQKEVFLKLPLMRNTFLNNKSLNFSKRQFSTQNGVKASKTVVSTQNIEKSNLDQKRSFSSYS